MSTSSWYSHLSKKYRINPYTNDLYRKRNASNTHVTTARDIEKGFFYRFWTKKPTVDKVRLLAAARVIMERTYKLVESPSLTWRESNFTIIEVSSRSNIKFDFLRTTRSFKMLASLVLQFFCLRFHDLISTATGLSCNSLLIKKFQVMKLSTIKCEKYPIRN